MTAPLQIIVDRAVKVPLTAQIHDAIRNAICDGRLSGGARLPSWRDLAAQLGVARGTVRAAYERLIDEQLIVGMGAAGTRVAAQAVADTDHTVTADTAPFAELFHQFDTAPMPFQMGVPAQDAFPFTLWSRIMARAARAAAAAPVGYPDPRGLPELRHEIAAYLAIARGIRCTPAQILITGGFAGALGLALRTLRLEGGTAWMEDPGFPLTRTALQLAGMTVAAVPVDAEGANVPQAPAASVAVVTPGQQAPLGMTMSLARRLALLEWAKANNAWIIEDDYLSELQLNGRAAPALASLDRHGRVLHAGTFAKTISPTLRLGFLVVPPQLASQFGTAAACLAPAPSAAVQRAVAEFMTEGHYLRHLRRMKRLYAARRDALVKHIGGETATSGLSVRMDLPPGLNDVDIATRALAMGLSPVPLSPWYMQAKEAHGLLLGVTNLSDRHLAPSCAKLLGLVHSPH